MTSLVWKIATCNVRGLNNPVKQDNIMNKFDGVWVFTSSLDSGYLDSGIAIIMDNFLARHVLVQFSQTGEINSLIAKAVNKSFFIILGGDFNENGAQKCASFKKCFDLGLVDSLRRSLFVKMSTWTNSCGVAKALDYILVSLCLVNAVIDSSVTNVENYFNTNYKAVSAFVGLGGLLNIYLNIVHKVMIFSANNVFKKKWFKGYNGMFIKESFKLHSLEILVSKIVKASHKVDSGRFKSLLKCWISMDNLVRSDASLNHVHSAFCGVRRSYHVSKLAESLQAEESGFRSAIEKRMESFVANKGHTIHSVLECPFYKVVLDYLVSNSSLILDPVEVKNKVDGIMKRWTRKRAHQYLPLDYVNNNAFSGVMNAISLDDLMCVIKDLPNGLLLDLLNICLVCESVLRCWKEAWVSMIFKPYEWEVCSLFNILHRDNFSVLKGITNQSPIFAIGLVIEDALEKDCELWLVLQDMHKAYDSIV
ncbi:hypothetical protein G9A89_021077 [Geosiphon pyriformis]|nr:hypothetical protein G9A89_021077 [Geosiphon pyriformis]